MGERHELTGRVHGEPLEEGRVGARVRVPLTGTPSPRWSQALISHLSGDLTGHAHVGHLRLGEIVQGRDLVLDGVEDPEAPELGRCLRGAVDAANRCCEADQPREPANMPRERAQAIADAVGAPVHELRH
jgi:hypothetical protein